MAINRYQIIAGISGAVLITTVIYGVMGYKQVKKERIIILSELYDARARTTELLLESRQQRGVIESFTGQISNLGNTVGTLEKLAQTDKELLRKYSKIYFLNENYIPATLADIDEPYIYNGSHNFLIHAKVWPYLRNLLESANVSGIKLLIASAYRSYGTQASLKSSYQVTYGSGANRFSADQGYSEHQLGTTADFTTEKIGGEFSKFEKDSAFEWLNKNAHKYGFILSYPDGNAYYKFEPWHWRFVGVKLATRLHDDGKYFYDLDQREIDKYLVNIFD
ncbi:MAG: M15 family metallopeptidase [Candidatus Zambryskibacteria bacterium]|nr:M15 family metallopeptidase [Candidatus Zambryskibacteria bacterium]